MSLAAYDTMRAHFDSGVLSMRPFGKPKYAICAERLRRRRKVVVRTLRYLDAERKIVEANRQWKSPSARRSRRRLVEQIRSWYDAELKRIDTVLDRLEHPSIRVASGSKSTAHAIREPP
jgi:hypothetical protein